MERFKKTVLILMLLFALVFSLDLFTGGAQTGKGAAEQTKPAAAQPQGKQAKQEKIEPVPPKTPQREKKGVDYKVFDHDDPAHRFACEKCHNNVDTGIRVTKFPNSHEKGNHACDTCHLRPIFTIVQNGAMCLICHKRPGNAKTGISPDVIAFPDQRDDQFGIIFPHNKHKGLDGKDFIKGTLDIDFFLQFNQKDPLVQTVAKESKCIECHAKDGKDKKQENFSSPHHPECARCHTAVKGGVDPNMQACEACHQIKAPTRSPITNLFMGFYHDGTHESDSRPKDKKDPKDAKLLTKDAKKLKCQFCHDVDRVTKLADLVMPLQSRCTVCHNDKKDPARPLTADELAKLKPDVKGEPAATK